MPSTEKKNSSVKLPAPDIDIKQICKLIEQGQTFEATSKDQLFTIKIEEYRPFICFAIHNGHKLRPELKKKCLLSDFERWQEEDPLTGELIKTFPITLTSSDSRYEYDLNRDENQCIYTTAWGKKVWKEVLTEEEKSVSVGKHRYFYQVIHALIKRIENDFGSCIIYDIHSYNYKRYTRYLPVFNLGTDLIDKRRNGFYINDFIERLQKIELPNIKTTIKENDIFNPT